MFSIPIITNIVIVKLNYDNFLLWSHQIEAFLIGQDLYKFVDSSHQCPATTYPGLPLLFGLAYMRGQNIYVDALSAIGEPVKNTNLVNVILRDLGSEYAMLVIALESLDLALVLGFLIMSLITIHPLPWGLQYC
ncbi:hypothetical protein IFM89_036242 [Coptis chinensis]|uniref:Retrotransposon Copia-like N-terminal domain-containing protein n=1 Tax=Coptis chinensis TaxID=261450 RepID=A0A835HQ54_9MAGN|nr:hypothetical protein IFM89_036242 [Coptis chinensis]